MSYSSWRVPEKNIMKRTQWVGKVVIGISAMLGVIFGIAVETAFAQGQRLVVFEAFFDPG